MHTNTSTHMKSVYSCARFTFCWPDVHEEQGYGGNDRDEGEDGVPAGAVGSPVRGRHGLLDRGRQDEVEGAAEIKTGDDEC